MKPTSHLIVSTLFLVACSSPVLAEAYGSGWYREIQATYGHEDNISRTYKSDEVSDEIASLSIGGGHSRKMGDNAQLILSAYLIQTKHDEYDALDSVALSLGADYTVQPSAGYDAPWYNFQFQAITFRYEDSDPREGVLVETDLSFNKRLTPVSTGRVGYRYKDHVFVGKSAAEENNDAAFDTDAHEIYLGIDYQLRRQVSLFGEYAYRHGDVRSTVSGGLPPAGNKYDAETIDDVFDPPCTRRCVHSYAYRVRGDTQLATFGIAFPISVVNVDAAASYFDSEGDNGKKYRNWLFKFGVLWNF